MTILHILDIMILWWGLSPCFWAQQYNLKKEKNNFIKEEISPWDLRRILRSFAFLENIGKTLIKRIDLWNKIRILSYPFFLEYKRIRGCGFCPKTGWGYLPRNIVYFKYSVFGKISGKRFSSINLTWKNFRRFAMRKKKLQRKMC